MFRFGVASEMSFSFQRGGRGLRATGLNFFSRTILPLCGNSSRNPKLVYDSWSMTVLEESTAVEG